MITAILIVLGLAFGSFVNALVWRIYQQGLPKRKRKADKKDLSVVNGRSMCVHCGHTLGALDLLPVVSWAALRGRCRYCKQRISWQYPLVEAITAALFVLSYALWPRDIEGWEVATFASWLICLVGFMALIIYDLRWMLLPNRIIFPLYGVAAAFVVSRMAVEHSIEPLWSSIAGVAIGGGIFYLIFQISKGAWIGGGDVKLGFLLGALLEGFLPGILMLFIASTLGSLVAIPLLAWGKAGRQTRIPFGPFLIAATIIVQLVGTSIIDWYTTNFIDI